MSQSYRYNPSLLADSTAVSFRRPAIDPDPFCRSPLLACAPRRWTPCTLNLSLPHSFTPPPAVVADLCTLAPPCSLVGGRRPRCACHWPPGPTSSTISLLYPLPSTDPIALPLLDTPFHARCVAEIYCARPPGAYSMPLAPSPSLPCVSKMGSCSGRVAVVVTGPALQRRRGCRTSCSGRDMRPAGLLPLPAAAGGATQAPPSAHCSVSNVLQHCCRIAQAPARCKLAAKRGDMASCAPARCAAPCSPAARPVGGQCTAAARSAGRLAAGRRTAAAAVQREAPPSASPWAGLAAGAAALLLAAPSALAADVVAVYEKSCAGCHTGGGNIIR